jgi:DNA-binding MurR/RpiR family transcriptional regulator
MPAKDQKIELNLEQLKAMVRIQCTQEECAAVLGMSADTLDRRLKELEYAGFAEFYKKYSHEGLASLRRAQWKAATEQLNPTMLVWMGKQMLGQQDKSSMEHSGKLAFEGIERVIIDPKAKAPNS